MHFSVTNQEINGIISREIRRQKLSVSRMTKKNLEEICNICNSIEKHSLPGYLIRKKMSQDLGYGIFLRPDSKPILKGQIIAPYAGEISLVPQNQPDDSAYAFELMSDIRLKKEEQILLDRKLRYHPRRFYSLKLDALKKGNFTRFINHSEKPNIIAHLVSIPSNHYGLTPSPIEVIYFAKKTILPGEQLLVCYEDGEKNYWNACKIKPYPMTPKTFQLNSSLKISREL